VLPLHKQVNQFAHLIQVNLANDTKRLKNAEILMHHTTYRLAEFLHLVSGEDKATVQATLKQLDQVNDELLTQVFNH
jgi:phage terminase large subunit